MLKVFLKYSIPFIFLIAFLIPGYTYFIVNKTSTVDVLSTSSSFSVDLGVVFRLLGLYAITFVWLQIISGAFLIPLIGLYGPAIFKLHRLEGIFALVFATFHPILFYSYSTLIFGFNALPFAIADYLGNPKIIIFGYFGPVVWTLLISTVLTALLMRHIKIWRKIHLLNYVVFLLAITHSFMIGTEVKLQPLRGLYLFFFLTFLLSFFYRVVYKRFLIKPQTSSKVAVKL